MDKKQENRDRGRKARAAGMRFERKVRHYLEEEGYKVDKFTNNVDFSLEATGKLVPAKRNRFGSNAGGFPDFIAWKLGRKIFQLDTDEPEVINKFMLQLERVKKTKEDIIVSDGVRVRGYHEIIGIESKSNGVLSPIEKKRCKWLLKNNVFENIYIAKKGKKRGEIIFDDFKECYKEKEDGTIRKVKTT